MQRYILEVDHFCDESFNNDEKQAWIELTQEQVALMKWLLDQPCFSFVSMASVDKMLLDFKGKGDEVV